VRFGVAAFAFVGFFCLSLATGRSSLLYPLAAYRDKNPIKFWVGQAWFMHSHS
jgi:hypothetical protein